MSFQTKKQIGICLGVQVGYLFTQIWPQILFALFLFYLVAQAFYLFERNKRQQALALEAKNDFIRNMTHELKTPIATVGVAVEALLDFGAIQNPERTKEYLAISKSALQRLSLLVDNVLKMAAFDDQKQLLHFEAFDFKQMVEETLQNMEVQFEKYQATVTFLPESTNEPYHYRGDRLHLTNVVHNLVDNALKYSPDAPVIHLKLSHHKSGLILSVSDKGKGIPAQYQQKIFERFFRVPAGDVHDVKGHGLGLSYVEQIVHQHGGHIEVSSEEGLGTIFTVYLKS